MNLEEKTASTTCEKKQSNKTISQMEKGIKSMSLKEKINGARKYMSVPKNNANSFLKYAYRNVEDLFELLAVVEEHFRFNYNFVHEDLQYCEGMYKISYEVHIVDLDSPEVIKTTMDVPFSPDQRKDSKLDPTQVFGGILTYARRYIISRDFQVRCGLANLDFDSDEQTQKRLEADAQENRELKAIIDKATSIEELNEVANRIKNCTDNSLKEVARKKYRSLKK